jgi:hypothetical protein
LDGLERLLGPDAVAAVKTLAADGVVLRHGERLWASPCLSRLEELRLIAARTLPRKTACRASQHAGLSVI